jgi:hypothetical protein
MGTKQSTDVSQEIMKEVMKGLKEVAVYLDDVGVFTDSWEQHLVILENVLQ